MTKASGVAAGPIRSQFLAADSVSDPYLYPVGVSFGYDVPEAWAGATCTAATLTARRSVLSGAAATSGLACTDTGRQVVTRAVSDDFQTFVRLYMQLLIFDGVLFRLRQGSGLSHSEIGKAAGTTGARVAAWESGRATPTTAEALAWLDAILKALPPSATMSMATVAADELAKANGHAR